MRTVVVLAVAGAIAAGFTPGGGPPAEWTPAQLRVLRSLSLSALGPVPPDPSNAFAGDPRAAALGRALFFDERLSANGAVSCSSCHRPARNFQDGRRLGRGLGVTPRRTMSLVGAAYATWLFWDGRKDSLWSQALGPLENRLEQGLPRAQVAAVVRARYRRQYERVFGRATNATRVFVNVGKAIEAYERTLQLRPARFDRYVAGEARLSARELAGVRLFIGKAGCLSCHNGSLFTNGEFHNTGVPPAGAKADEGRAAGLALLRKDEFNCLGRFSDAKPNECAIRFLESDAKRRRGAFKPPSLRNVTRNAPYMHQGQFPTLRRVLEHYRRAPKAAVGRSELHPRDLSDDDLRAIEAFLRTLESAVVER